MNDVVRVVLLVRVGSEIHYKDCSNYLLKLLAKKAISKVLPMRLDEF